MAEPELEGRFSIFQQFLQHALDCADPNCILPLCVNIKLTLRHSQICRKKVNCTIYQEMKNLGSKHSEHCDDYYCRVPFRMESKVEMFQRATQIDLSDCLDVILQDKNSWGQNKERVTVELKSNGKVPPPPANSTPPGHQPLNNCPPMAIEESVNYLLPLHNPSSFSNSPSNYHAQPIRGQSSVTVPTETASSQWGGTMGPYSVYNQSTSTTSTQEMATSFVERRETATTIHQSLIDISSSYPPSLEQNVSSHQILPKHQQKFQEFTDQLNAGCASVPSQAEGAFHDALLAVGRVLSSRTEKETSVNNTQNILLKVRLTDALFGLMRLVVKAKTKGELLTCVDSLKSALREIKVLNQQE